MKRSLYCSQCRVRLTQALEVVSLKDPSVPKPEFDMQKPLSASGTALKSWQAMPWIGCSWDHGLDYTPQYWLNPDDVIAVRLGGDRRSAMGCCGPMGLNGPNQMCRRCNAPVGTLQADCSTPFVFITNPKTTTWVEGEEDYWAYS